MSIYHKWRSVFVQIPKNASSSIHEALKNPTDDSHDHNLYIDVLGSNDPELVESYFSFAVCRNPYDRFVSAYEYLRQNSGYTWNPSFEDLVKDFHNRGPYFYTGEDVVWWPQSRFVSIKNIVLVDKIIKYENLDQEWPIIIEEISKVVPASFSLPTTNVQRINVTEQKQKPTWPEYYTEETKQMVYNLYQKDFKLFNYEK